MISLVNNRVRKMRLTTKTLYGTRALPDLAIHQKGNSEYCAARDIRGDVKQAVDRALVATTLQDLAERQTSKGPAVEMYII